MSTGIVGHHSSAHSSRLRSERLLFWYPQNSVTPGPLFVGPPTFRFRRPAGTWRTKVIALATAGWIWSVGSLAAQEQRDTVQLDPVVVTGTRLPVPRSSVPLAITVLDGDALQAQGLRRVTDALRLVPGVAVVQNGSFGGTASVFLRGGEANYVKVLVDGVAINQPGGAVDLAHLTLDNVERIEIVRGPASVLYGSDAVVGVVQIVTRRGQGSPRTHLALRAGTFGTAAAEASLSAGTDAVRYGFGFSRSTTDGILAFNNAYDNTAWSGSVHAAPGAATTVDLSLRYTDSEFHVPTDGAGRAVDRNAFSLHKQVAGALDVGHWFSGPVEGRLLLTLNQFVGGFDDEPDGPADTVGFFGARSMQNLTRRAADGRVNLHLRRAIITTGIVFEDEEERSFSQSLSQFDTSTSTVDVARRTYAYYGQLQASPAAAWALTAGLRIDDNEQFGTFATYRGALSYKPLTDTRVRASVGRAFKEPTFIENFSANPSFRGNPDLSPERSFAWEAGLEQTFHEGRVRLAAMFFYQRFRDLIQFTSPAQPGGPNFRNIPAADASGVEVEAEVNPMKGLTAMAGLTLLNTRVRDPGPDTASSAEFVKDSTLLRRPKRTVTISVDYRPRDRMMLGVSVRHVGDRADRDFSSFPAVRVRLPRYTDLAVFGEVDIIRPARGAVVTLTGRVDNALDERYQEAFGFAAPGRRIVAGAMVRF